VSIPRVKFPIVLDKPRTLKLSFNAFVLVEQVTGRSMLSGELELSSLTALRAIMWAGLVHEDPALTLDVVGDLLEDYGIAKAIVDLGAAIGAAMPDLMVEESTPVSDPQGPPNGGMSGQSADTISD